MTITSVLVALLTLFSMVVPSRADEAGSTAITGNWQGSYVCAQGVTGLTLTIEQQTGQQFSGTFHFYALRENANVPEGCFTVSGRVTAGQTVEIAGMAWIKRPLGYLTVDLRGKLAPDGSAMSGAVTVPGYPNLCSRFDVAKMSPKPSVAESCRPQAPVISYAHP